MARRMMNKVKDLEDVPEVNDDDKMIGFDEWASKKNEYKPPKSEVRPNNWV